jgi:hypothetical protein
VHPFSRPIKKYYLRSPLTALREQLHVEVEPMRTMLLNAIAFD